MYDLRHQTGKAHCLFIPIYALALIRTRTQTFLLPPNLIWTLAQIILLKLLPPQPRTNPPKCKPEPCRSKFVLLSVDCKLCRNRRIQWGVVHPQGIHLNYPKTKSSTKVMQIGGFKLPFTPYGNNGWIHHHCRR